MIQDFITPKMDRLLSKLDANNSFTKEDFCQFMGNYPPKDAEDFKNILRNLEMYAGMFLATVIAKNIQTKLGLSEPPKLCCDCYTVTLDESASQPKEVVERMAEILELIKPAPLY